MGRSALAAILVLGCGQATQSTQDASSIEDAASVDTSEPDPFGRPDSGPSRPFQFDGGPLSCAPCPTPAPTEGDPCTNLGLECEYGNHPYRNCNQGFTCQNTLSGVRWITWWDPHGPCDPPTTGGDCPATPPTLGQVSCTGVSSSLVCGYGDGFCSCFTQLDGSQYWACDMNAPAPCPPRIKLGCPCPDACNVTMGTCWIACGANANIQCTD